MQPLIYCRNNRPEQLDFFLAVQNGRYYLFTQKYHHSVFRFFADGVSLDQAFDCGSCYFNGHLVNVKSKLPKYVRYLELENDIAVLRKTRKAREIRRYSNAA